MVFTNADGTKSCCYSAPAKPLQQPVNAFDETKVVLIGSYSAGKTSFCNVIAGRGFTNTMPTVGASFMSIALSNEKKHRLSVWDTAGSEKYRSLAPMYLRGARLVILVVDASDSKQQDEWFDTIGGVIESCSILVLYHKCDLLPELKRYTANFAQPLRAFSEHVTTRDLNGYTLYEATCSSRTGEGIQNVLQFLKDFVLMPNVQRLSIE